MSKQTIPRSFVDTEEMLVQWGLWLSSGSGIPRYISPAYVVMRDNVEQHGCPSHCITDELAMAVDGAMARLSVRERLPGRKGPFIHEFMWLHFACKMSHKMVGTKLKCSEARAREIIRAGVAWIDSSLELMLEAA